MAVEERWDLQAMADSITTDRKLTNGQYTLVPFTRPVLAWRN